MPSVEQELLRTLPTAQPPSNPKVQKLCWSHQDGTDDANAFANWIHRVRDYTGEQSSSANGGANINTGMFGPANTSAKDKMAAYNFLIKIADSGLMLAIALDKQYLNDGIKLLQAIKDKYEPLAEKATNSNLKVQLEYLEHPSHVQDDTAGYRQNRQNHSDLLLRTFAAYNEKAAQDKKIPEVEMVTTLCNPSTKTDTVHTPYMSDPQRQHACSTVATIEDGRYKAKADATMEAFFAAADTYHILHNGSQTSLGAKQPGQPRGGGVLNVDRAGEVRPQDKPCRFFKKGNCKKGADCPYSHANIKPNDGYAKSGGKSDKHNSGKSEKRKKDAPTQEEIKVMKGEKCINHQNGRCSWGAKCYRIHDKAPGTPPSKQRRHQSSDSDKEPCAKYLTGNCTDKSCDRPHLESLRRSITRQLKQPRSGSGEVMMISRGNLKAAAQQDEKFFDGSDDEEILVKMTE